MIVLYGGDNSTPGGISGYIDIDLSFAEVEEITSTTSRKFTATSNDSQNIFTFTDVPEKKLIDVSASYIVTIPGADNAEIDSATFTMKDCTMGVPSVVTGPVPKDEMFNMALEFESSFSRTNSIMNATLNGVDIGCNIDIADREISVQNDKLYLEYISGDNYRLVVKLDDSIFLGACDYSYLDSIKFVVAVTVGTVTELSEEKTISFSSLIYRPKITDRTRKYIYTVSGEFHMAGGWTTNNILPMAKHKVFAQDIDMVTSLFRNKLYGTVDPVAFTGSLIKFLPTAGKVGSNFTYMNTISTVSPWPFNASGTSEYESKDSSGNVQFDVVSGEMTVDTESASTDSGFAIFRFEFDDSVYSSQFFYMPCVIDNSVPKAVVFDGKIAYDRIAVFSEIDAITLPLMASAWSFFTFYISYQESLANLVLSDILNLSPFIVYTRGLACGLLDNSILSILQIVIVNEHTKFVSDFGGPIHSQFGNFLRKSGYVMSRSLRGLTRIQQEAVMAEYMLSVEDELNRTISKPGVIIMSFCGMPITTFFYYTDGFYLKPSAIGGFFDTDINKLHEDNNLPDDEFRAAVRKHTLFSYQYSRLSILAKNGGWHGYPAFNGSLTRIIKDGKINEIGGVDNPDYAIAKNWSNIPITYERLTLDEEVSFMMTRAKADRFSRMVMGSGLNDGVPYNELNSKPSPMSASNVSAFGIGAKNAKIVHLDLSEGTMRTWSREKEGVLENVRILRPNSNIILAV